MTVLDVGKENLIVAYPDELLSDAVAKMVKHNIGRLPVVDRDHPRKLVGYLGRAAIMSARLKHLEEESLREPGWFSRPSLGI
jgi:chloride channel protein, CIC family